MGDSSNWYGDLVVHTSPGRILVEEGPAPGNMYHKLLIRERTDGSFYVDIGDQVLQLDKFGAYDEAANAGVPDSDWAEAFGPLQYELQADLDLAPPTGDLPTEPGYFYHATTVENIYDIALEGLLPHEPWVGTDQDAWPDGRTEPRVYFSGNAGVVWGFAPTEGTPAVLRVSESDVPLFMESGTGDRYTESPVRPDLLQVLGQDGIWHPIRAVNEDASETQLQDAEDVPSSMPEVG